MHMGFKLPMAGSKPKQTRQIAKPWEHESKQYQVALSQGCMIQRLQPVQALSVTVHELLLCFSQQVLFWQFVEFRCKYEIVFCETITGVRPQFHQDVVPALAAEYDFVNLAW